MYTDDKYKAYFKNRLQNVVWYFKIYLADLIENMMKEIQEQTTKWNFLHNLALGLLIPRAYVYFLHVVPYNGRT